MKKIAQALTVLEDELATDIERNAGDEEPLWVIALLPARPWPLSDATAESTLLALSVVGWFRAAPDCRPPLPFVSLAMSYGPIASLMGRSRGRAGWLGLVAINRFLVFLATWREFEVFGFCRRPCRRTSGAMRPRRTRLRRGSRWRVLG